MSDIERLGAANTCWFTAVTLSTAPALFAARNKYKEQIIDANATDKLNANK